MSALVHSNNQALLNAVNLAAVKHHAETLELPPCPFCGGVAQVCLGMVNYTPYVLIRCERCGGSTKALDAESQDSASANAAITAAAARWSRRP